MLIPTGAVATYGDEAEGAVWEATEVGRALRGLPQDTRIPWHRVINAQGKLVAPGGSAALQRERLESEGIAFRSRSGLDLRQYRWRPGG